MLFQKISLISSIEAAQSEMTNPALNLSTYSPEINNKKQRIEQNKNILVSDTFGLKAKDCLCCSKKPAPFVTQNKHSIRRSKKVCREEGRVTGNYDVGKNFFSFIQQKATKPSSSSSSSSSSRGMTRQVSKPDRQGNSEEDHLLKEW